ncbi:hypothetical protein VTP01DRAFT_1402 [Rhizomucor pusillus]|uniref:uncharacterized protein n=1 Tax=Rhizomucor pusillus TaxID=4840 RepID=UPI0037440466
MELNICLYCETRLLDDSLSFCSSTCQANEAAKSPTVNIPATSSPPISSIAYEMSYHRRRSLSGGPRSHSSLLLSSSFVSDASSSSYSDLATP